MDPCPVADRGSTTLATPPRSVVRSLRLALTLCGLVWSAMPVVVMHVAVRMHPMEEVMVMHVMMGVMMMAVLVSPPLNSGRQSQDCPRKGQSSKSGS